MSPPVKIHLRGDGVRINRPPLCEIIGPELLQAPSVNWSANKQYMDFLHSQWARSIQHRVAGPCPVFLFRSRGTFFVRVCVCWIQEVYTMRTSTCGTVMLVCATILGPITIVFLAVSFATDHWLEFKVDRTRYSGSDPNRVTHTRYRGIFRECYPGNDTACK